jgi:hypothetical protein
VKAEVGREIDHALTIGHVPGRGLCADAPVAIRSAGCRQSHDILSVRPGLK